MIITLTPDIEQALAAEARKLGRTPEQLALDSLRERFLSQRATCLSKGNRPPLPTCSADISASCTAANTSLVGHACPKIVDESLPRPSSPSANRNGHDAHRCWGLGSTPGC